MRSRKLDHSRSNNAGTTSPTSSFDGTQSTANRPAISSTFDLMSSSSASSSAVRFFLRASCSYLATRAMNLSRPLWIFTSVAVPSAFRISTQRQGPTPTRAANSASNGRRTFQFAEPAAAGKQIPERFQNAGEDDSRDYPLDSVVPRRKDLSEVQRGAMRFDCVDHFLDTRAITCRTLAQFRIEQPGCVLYASRGRSAYSRMLLSGVASLDKA